MPAPAHWLPAFIKNVIVWAITGILQILQIAPRDRLIIPDTLDHAP
jgi:hypothetical protein